MSSIKMILTNRYDPDVRVYKEAKYLVSKGHDVEILCWDRESEYIDKEIEENDGIKVKRFFPYAKYGSGLKQIKAYFKYIFQLNKYLKNKKFDYIHCHDLDGVIAGYFSKKNNVLVVFDMHEFYEVQGKKQKLRYAIRSIVNFLQNKVDYIIFVNDSQKSVMSDSNKKKLIYLPNYPDAEQYRDSIKSSSKQLRISYIGAVRQYDELKNLMDACLEMPNVKIAIHGAGVAHRKLYNIKGNYKNVDVTGVYHISEIKHFYNNTDVLYAVYPMNTVQNRTAYPVKFFEAIITKTPIIVSKGSIIEDFLKENDIGFAVDGSDVKEIKELVEYLSKNQSILEEKRRNLEKIQYDYSWDEVVKNLDRIYSK